MIVDELAARFSFSVEGLEKVRRAIEMFRRLQRAIVAFAAAVAQRLGRVAGILAKTSAAAAAFGTVFVAKAAVITAAAGAATGALGVLAAAFARMRRETVDTALINGVDVRELALVEKIMARIGSSAKDGRKFVTDFVDKLREGVKDGGDWADALAKQKVKIKDPKGKARPFSNVVEDILRAADKMKDVDKKRGFLKEALEGAPDEFLSQLAQSTSAFEKWKQLVTSTRKEGGGMSLGDVLNVQDITDALGRVQTVLTGFMESFGSGLMAALSQDFRKLGEAIASVANDENRAKVRQFAGDMVAFLKSVQSGGATVLSAVASAFSALTSALGTIDEATGGRLGQIATGLGLLLGAITVAAAAPLVAVSAAITGILYAIGEFQKWNAGGDSPLKGFFDAIADGARDAKAVVDALLESLRSLPSLKDLISPQAPAGAADADTPAAARRRAIEKGVQDLETLRQKRTEMSPDVQGQKIARDKQAASTTDSRSYKDIGNDHRNMPVSVKVEATGLDAVVAAVKNAVLGAISTKGSNTSTGALTAP